MGPGAFQLTQGRPLIFGGGGALKIKTIRAKNEKPKTHKKERMSKKIVWPLPEKKTNPKVLGKKKSNKICTTFHHRLLIVDHLDEIWPIDFGFNIQGHE